MIDISKHITMSEACRSSYAAKHKIINLPGVSEIQNMQYLAQTVFEPLRSHFGDNPIKINSFYRGTKLNAAIGGASNSQHVSGQAFDLELTAEQFHYIRENLPFDQLIWEGGDDNQPAWVHVSLTRGVNRYQVLKAKKNSAGKMVYSDITKTFKK